MHVRRVVWLLSIVLIAAMFCALSPRAAWHSTLIEQYHPLLEADALIHKNYVNAVQDRELTEAALRGLMQGLDPYSSYLSAEQWQTYKDRLAGKLVGIGIEIGTTGGEAVVISPFAGSPSERAGIQAGDRLVSIDGIDAVDQTVFEINAHLTGSPGTTVALVLRRPPGNNVLRFEVERERFKSESVRGYARSEDGWQWMIDKEYAIAYIRIADFGESVIAQFDEAIAACSSQNVRGLVIDLRNNPGGLVPQAVELIDRFVEPSDLPLLITQSRLGALTKSYATQEGTDSDMAIVVLINGYSASAAEIVAGSLQDHQRATIVGTQSFGKGSIQHVLPLRDGGAIRLTSEYYRLPKGRVVHRMLHQEDDDQWGVTPDVTVDGSVAVLPVDVGQPSGTSDAQLEAAMNILSRRLSSQND